MRQPQQQQLGRRDSLVAHVLTAEAQSLDVTKVRSTASGALQEVRHLAACDGAHMSQMSQQANRAKVMTVHVLQMAPLGDRLLVQPEEESGVSGRLHMLRCACA